MEFPAHAGMNRMGKTTRELIKRVPRTRGDEPLAPLRRACGLSSSPHTRG